MNYKYQKGDLVKLRPAGVEHFPPRFSLSKLTVERVYWGTLSVSRLTKTGKKETVCMSPDYLRPVFFNKKLEDFF